MRFKLKIISKTNTKLSQENKCKKAQVFDVNCQNTLTLVGKKMLLRYIFNRAYISMSSMKTILKGKPNQRKCDKH